MKKVGVVLAGCGFLDGAEVYESVLTMLALDRAGAAAVCFAPDAAQRDVVDHVGQKPVEETRNVLRESARICRGEIRSLAQARVAELDALVVPGGYGAAKNLCDFAVAGERATVHPELQRLIREMHAAGKPMGFVCIAPAVAAAAFRGTAVHPRLTIGTDPGTAGLLEKMGARPVSRGVEEIEVDPENKIVSTAAYMLAERISQAATGIDRLVERVLALA